MTLPTNFRRTVFRIALALALGWTASASAKTKVVASFSILADMVSAIGGEHVSVKTLVGPESDAHVYQPTPADARAIGEARLVIVNGLGFEGWIDRLLRASETRATIVVASAGIEILAMDREDEDKPVGRFSRKVTRPGKVPDPHAWQDAENGKTYAENIVAALIKVDPDRTAEYRRGGENYAAALAAVDAEIRDAFRAIPETKRRVITSHDAFRYFGKAYGVEFMAAQGISTESEPSARDVAKLIDQARKENIRALFVENISDRRLIEQIAREAGASVGAPLYSDALSRNGGPADTYLKMLKNNAASLIEGIKLN